MHLPAHACSPAGQLVTQFPEEHAVPELHVVPHVPQFPGSVSRSVQNAFTPNPQAFGFAIGQEQEPPSHCCPAGQATPAFPAVHVAEAPQCAVFVRGSTQLPPQLTSPAAQFTVHVPCEQTLPRSHLLSQAPQFWTSVVRSAQKALAPSLHAFGRAVGQEHEPPEHC